MEIINLTEGAFDAAVAQGVTLVDFWATWCGPCKMMGTILEQQVVPQLEGVDARICKVNVDDSPALAARFEVLSIPTLLFFKDGSLAARMEGVQTPETVVGKVKELRS